MAVSPLSFPRHPLHPSRNPTPEEYKYWVKYYNNGNNIVSGITRGIITPRGGITLELRQRYAQRAIMRREREASKPLERSERRMMNDCDGKKFYMSNAEMTLAEEEEKEREREALEEEEREGGAMVPPGEEEMAVSSNQYTEQEIAQNANLALELAALKTDDKVTSMSKKGEKVLRQSPREDKGGREEAPSTPTAGIGKDKDGATPGSASVMRHASRYVNKRADSQALTGPTAASRRKIRFEDEAPAPASAPAGNEASALGPGY